MKFFWEEKLRSISMWGSSSLFLFSWTDLIAGNYLYKSADNNLWGWILLLQEKNNGVEAKPSLHLAVIIVFNKGIFLLSALGKGCSFYFKGCPSYSRRLSVSRLGFLDFLAKSHLKNDALLVVHAMKKAS